MYHGVGSGVDKIQGRQEGQFDIGLVNRVDHFQIGLFSSIKYLNMAQYGTGGALAQGSAHRGLHIQTRPLSASLEPRASRTRSTSPIRHSGRRLTSRLTRRSSIRLAAAAWIGLWGDSYLEGNVGYLRLHGPTAGRPGATVKFVQPLSRLVALTVEGDVNESLVTTANSGRIVFGLQFGNMMRPKEYGDTKNPVPVDVPRIRYQLLTRQVGHSPPVADAGPAQIVPAGTVTLNGSASYSPDGDALTYQWTQTGGPSASISGANTAIATFTAAASSFYTFRLTVKAPSGLQSSANTTVTVQRAASITILEFSATPDTLISGQSSQLRWNVKGATSISISPTVGGGLLPQGTKTVSPTATTTYTLTATAAGVPTQTATVTISIGAQVGNPQIIRFQATPTNIISGESSTLSWTTSGATNVTISGVSGNLPASGSVVVSPTQTTTYTLTATANGVSVTEPVVVTVGNGQLSRIIGFTANPMTIRVAAARNSAGRWRTRLLSPSILQLAPWARRTA